MGMVGIHIRNPLFFFFVFKEESLGVVGKIVFGTEAEAMASLDDAKVLVVFKNDEDWRKLFRPNHWKADRNIFGSSLCNNYGKVYG
jgi:hypothetical protein